MFVTFSCCERSKLPIGMNVLHRINIVLLIFILHLSELQVFLKISLSMFLIIVSCLVSQDNVK